MQNFYCTNFKYRYLHEFASSALSLGLIDVLSANRHTEIFPCMLLKPLNWFLKKLQKFISTEIAFKLLVVGCLIPNTNLSTVSAHFQYGMHD